MKAAPASNPPNTPRMTATLRRIGFLPRRPLPGGSLLRRRLLSRSGRLPGGGLARSRLWLQASQRRLEVVEDEPDRRVLPRRGRNRGLLVADDEDAAFRSCDLELGQRALARLELLRAGKQLCSRLGQHFGAGRVCQRRARDLSLAVEDDRGLDLRGDLG